MAFHRGLSISVLVLAIAGCVGAPSAGRARVTVAGQRAAPSAPAVPSDAPAGSSLASTLGAKLSLLANVETLSTRSTLAEQADAVLSHNGGNVLSHNGGNVLSHNGGNVISHNGGNVISHNGGNLISDASAGVLSHNGGNVISNNGGGVISPDGTAVLSHNGGNELGVDPLDPLGDGTGVLSHNGGNVISNNGGGVLSHNGGNVLSHNGGNVIANNGGNVIANNGGNVISHNGGNFALLDTALPPAIVGTASGSERQLLAIQWIDGSAEHAYEASNNVDNRIVWADAGGTPQEELAYTVTQTDADGHVASARVRHTKLFGGNFGLLDTGSEDYRPAGKAAHLMRDGSWFRDPDTGSEIHLERFNYDRDQHAGSYRYVYSTLGLVDEGTFTGSLYDASGQLGFNFRDPLIAYFGDGKLTTQAGDLVATRHRTFEAGRQLLTYELAGGVTLQFVLKSALPPYDGVVSQNGKPIGTVTLAREADGVTRFDLAFDDPAQPPLHVGLDGMVTDAAASDAGGTAPAPAATSAPVLPDIWDVETAIAPASTPFQPAGLTLSGGTLYLGDQAAHLIRRFAYQAQGTDYKLVVQPSIGSGTAGSTDGTLATASFSQPMAIAPAPDGTLYIGDQDKPGLRVVAPDGTITTLAAGPFADGPAATAGIGPIAGLALDAANQKLYVADYTNSRIRVVDLAAKDRPVSTLAGDGTADYADGPGATAKIRTPVGLALVGRRLVVADADDRCIRAIDLDAAAHPVTTLAGAPTGGYVDGAAATARFGTPIGVVADATGNLYVSDAAYHSIRKISPDGQVRTLAGGNPQGFLDGYMNRAHFYAPMGLAVDPDSGRLFIADLGNQRLRVAAPVQVP